MSHLHQYFCALETLYGILQVIYVCYWALKKRWIFAKQMIQKMIAFFFPQFCFKQKVNQQLNSNELFLHLKLFAKIICPIII